MVEWAEERGARTFFFPISQPTRSFSLWMALLGRGLTPTPAGGEAMYLNSQGHEERKQYTAVSAHPLS
jgi:hypothetical protein